MSKVISATEAKATLSALMEWAVRNQDEVIIQSRGNPKAVLISYDAYEEFKSAQEKIERQEALARLEALAARVQAKNQDLSQEEAEALADQITREAIDEMVAEGKVRFK